MSVFSIFFDFEGIVRLETGHIAHAAYKWSNCGLHLWTFLKNSKFHIKTGYFFWSCNSYFYNTHNLRWNHEKMEKIDILPNQSRDDLGWFGMIFEHFWAFLSIFEHVICVKICDFGSKMRSKIANFSTKFEKIDILPNQSRDDLGWFGMIFEHFWAFLSIFEHVICVKICDFGSKMRSKIANFSTKFEKIDISPNQSWDDLGWFGMIWDDVWAFLSIFEHFWAYYMC